MYIAIINYNIGNIKSVENAFIKIGAEIKVTKNPGIIINADAVVLPGVGSFGDAVKNLKELKLYDVIKEIIYCGTPFLGICIGLHVLFEFGMEGGKNKGLGIFKGIVKKIPEGVKIPHMGWNRLKILNKKSKLLEGIKDGESFYFVHSYLAECEDKSIISSTTDYGVDIAASVEYKNTYGVQFHPEKSSTCGLQILSNFVNIAKTSKKKAG
jgi:glutamine amidotransferase